MRLHAGHRPRSTSREGRPAAGVGFVTGPAAVETQEATEQHTGGANAEYIYQLSESVADGGGNI